MKLKQNFPLPAPGRPETARARRLSANLVAWYERHHRRLPWRVTPDERAEGIVPDPYRVWLSEIMLQQTTVTTVKAYFEKFITQWPSVEALAAASDEEVMKAWAGLGYYARARNLKKCAETVANDHHGRFPEDAAALRRLPGIGAYTCAAITTIAFDRPAAVVDGNVERVVSRLCAIDTPLPAAKAEITAIMAALTPQERPGDFAQAMMDLGATICTPQRPACALCPLREDCAGARSGTAELFPVKPAKKAKPARKGAAFVATDPLGAVHLRKRPAKGLLGGMSEVPTTGWTARSDGETDKRAAPFPGNWQKAGQASHVFTHFSLNLTVWHAELTMRPDTATGWWSLPADIASEALPSVMKKAIATAIPDAFKARSKHDRTAANEKAS